MTPPLNGEAVPRLAAGSPKDALVRALPSDVSEVAVGGGGRYLLLVLKKARKLAIFDVNAADVVKTISLPSDNVLVAAGAGISLWPSPTKICSNAGIWST